jgi:hypothetical protein
MEYEYDLAAWTEDKEASGLITTEKLDEEVRKLVTLEQDYDAKKKISNEANEKYENQRTYLLALLRETGKSKYHVDGVGTVSMAIKTAVPTPKDPSDKRKMIEYFLTLEDGAVFPAYLSVNHQTLNSYINQQTEIDPDFRLPGVEGKKETPELRFRKTK